MKAVVEAIVYALLEDYQPSSTAWQDAASRRTMTCPFPRRIISGKKACTVQ